MSATCNSELIQRLRDAADQACAEGRFADAEAAWRAVLKESPNDANAAVNLGASLRMLGRDAEARRLFEQVLAVLPTSVEALTNLALICDEQGQLAEAIAYYERALALRPDPRLRLLAATILPVVYESAKEILDWRRRLTAELNGCQADGICCDLDAEPGTILFHLAYQGLNDRDLQRSFARLHRVPAGPKPDPPPDPGTRRIRVGFVSRYLGEHTIGRLFGGAIARLDATEFEVVVLALGRAEGPVADTLRRRAAAYVELPFDLAAARRSVVDQRLDLLCYCDVGMEPWGTALAHARLAPIQCATWGHPVTTGVDAIDYFISSEALEVSEADEHYTEKLVRLPRLFCYYERPRLPEHPADRSAFGLPADAHLYGCLQTLFKLHPDFDPLIAAILRRDPAGLLTLVAGSSDVWRERLWKRFRRTLPDVLDRVHLLPSVLRSEYLQLVAVHDVLLDPLHVGGGNTSFEGFARGVPIVTLPSRLLRGRITAALYGQMGLSDCVAASAEQYVDMAVRLGTDPELRRATVARIEQAAPRIFENEAGVRDLEAFFRRAVAGPLPGRDSR